uniref:Uncharacterized protein n=1 Tax=Glossina palpalis gambiensis TaxID=67801 RepID=A0A1B0BEQ9_9MUSC
MLNTFEEVLAKPRKDAKSTTTSSTAQPFPLTILFHSLVYGLTQMCSIGKDEAKSNLIFDCGTSAVVTSLIIASITLYVFGTMELYITSSGFSTALMLLSGLSLPVNNLVVFLLCSHCNYTLFLHSSNVMRKQAINRSCVNETGHKIGGSLYMDYKCQYISTKSGLWPSHFHSRVKIAVKRSLKQFG